MSRHGDLPDNLWSKMRAFTRARIGLERSGDGMPTAALLNFQLDHAHARDTVHRKADFTAIALQVGVEQPILNVHSAALDRPTYLRRPDLGRVLDEPSRHLLEAQRAQEPWDVAFIVADGLSSAAINDHAAATLNACRKHLHGWSLAPIVLAAQARVALGDEVGVRLNINCCVVLIGERPGLSVANSLSAYITWRPTIGHLDADRNCISNIHADGLSHEQAANKICWLLTEARRRRLSGIALKEDAAALPQLNSRSLSLMRFTKPD